MSEFQIPGFEILGLIGRGGMASVWKARQISLDRTVAIKVLSAHFSHTAADIERFQEESRAAARLKHPGIIQVYDAGNQNGAYYFVMEYVAGYTVGAWLRRRGTLPEHEVLTVAECVADALDYAWRQAGMVHCDIKPDNVIVDADGSVKLADLGLSRTIKAMSRDAGESGDEILGTPAYISPEQAMVDPGLDCRSDVYSLGAMLYHLLTGRRLFQGNPDEHVIELQCTGQEENPGQMVPSLSKGVCALIERMLAKDPQFRHADWRAFKEDLLRVKAGHLPAQLLPGHAISTVKHTPLTRLQMAPDGAHAALQRWQEVDRPSPLALGLKIGAVALGCLIAIIVVLNSGSFRHRVPPPLPPSAPSTPTTTSTTTTTTRSPADDLRERARRDFEAARRWINENPDQPREGLRRMHEVMALDPGGEVGALVAEEVRKLRTAIRQKAEGVMRDLAAKCEPLLAERKFAEAVQVYERYSGPGAAESTPERRAMVETLLRLASESEKKDGVPPAAPSTQSVLAGAVAQVLEGRIAGASALVAEAMRAAGGDGSDELRSADLALRAAAGADASVLQSFQDSVGQEVSVQFNSGPLVLTIQQVSTTQVVGMCRITSGDVSASRRVAFGAQDLSMRERLARMGADDQPGVAIVKGMLAFQARAFAHARRYFKSVPEPLGSLLLERVDQEESPPVPGAAQEAAPPVGSPGAGAAPVRPAFALSKDLLAVKDDVAKVRDLMYRRNPSLAADNLDIGTNSTGQAESVTVRCGKAMDLSPLAALTTLKAVTYWPDDVRENGALKDVSGLQGLSLQSVTVAKSRVCDLAPLRGMPLREACFADSPIRDLSPLRGMPLEKLDIQRSSVMDLSPLSGMPLKVLKIDGTVVRRVQVLKSLPLTCLSASASPMQDFTWLQSGTNLVELVLAGTSVRAIDALAAMPLRSLDLSRTPVSDIGCLSGKKLARLSLDATAVRDFSVLKGMPLHELSLEGTAFSDVGLLTGMPLTRLKLARTGVKDIQALEGMGLVSLNLQDLSLASLAPLAKCPLQVLDLRGCVLPDMRPLHGMNLTHLWIDSPERKVVFIQTLPELRYLNGIDLYYAEGSPFRRAPRPRNPRG